MHLLPKKELPTNIIKVGEVAKEEVKVKVEKDFIGKGVLVRGSK